MKKSVDIKGVICYIINASKEKGDEIKKKESLILAQDERWRHA